MRFRRRPSAEPQPDQNEAVAWSRPDDDDPFARMEATNGNGELLYRDPPRYDDLDPLDLSLPEVPDRESPGRPDRPSGSAGEPQNPYEALAAAFDAATELLASPPPRAPHLDTEPVALIGGDLPEPEIVDPTPPAGFTLGQDEPEPDELETAAGLAEAEVVSEPGPIDNEFAAARDDEDDEDEDEFADGGPQLSAADEPEDDFESELEADPEFEPEFASEPDPDEDVPDEPPAQVPSGPAPAAWPPRPVPVAGPDPDSVQSGSWGAETPAYTADGVVRAAGGVVWTRWGAQLRVLLIHRPKYDDWSLPKGKADPGESDSACALREVREETGLACSLGEELTTVEYHDRHGRPKVVRYWSMQPLGGAFEPNAEVDRISWAAVDEAARMCTYARDAEVIKGLAAAVEPPVS